MTMSASHQKTLRAIFAHPVPANIKWKKVEMLLVYLGAELLEREGSRVAVVLNGEVNIFHRPHPSPDTDKGAVAAVRRMLERHGFAP